MRKLAFYDAFPADAFLSQGSRYRCLYSVSRLDLGLTKMQYTGRFSLS